MYGRYVEVGQGRTSNVREERAPTQSQLVAMHSLCWPQKAAFLCEKPVGDITISCLCNAYEGGGREGGQAQVSLTPGDRLAPRLSETWCAMGHAVIDTH